MQAQIFITLSSLAVGILAGEAIHLVNCSGQHGYASYVVYCEQDNNCNFTPIGNNECTVSSGHFNTWEGAWQSCTFQENDVSFSWNIEGDAQSRGLYTQVGTGSNGFRNFNIFRDDDHEMWGGNGQQCNSVYYALDA
ncbi:hypothetical protein NQ176_g4056 [Zarea fungicola]|uniref:Uncharacterized protein n=1 Tax=Zarea fungicola TaxID=93591 RepID=A0ACC1NFD7_9HYPO|nr:hypothetical protein NQ176_g4056 [Lecanicillium fungicola]